MTKLPTAPNGIEALWNDFHSELLAFARPRLASDSEAEDVLQTAFLRAHDHLRSGTTPSNARAWLYRIVRNLVVDTYRHSARRREVLASEADVDPDAVEDLDSSDVDNDARACVARALPIFIKRLPSPYREALQLTELEGLTQAEAATRSGVSLSGMKSRVQRARKQLLESLYECCEFGLDARNRVIACNTRSVDEAQCSSTSCDERIK